MVRNMHGPEDPAEMFEPVQPVELQVKQYQ
jgi:hypothetical protein